MDKLCLGFDTSNYTTSAAVGGRKTGGSYSPSRRGRWACGRATRCSSM